MNIDDSATVETPPAPAAGLPALVPGTHFPKPQKETIGEKIWSGATYWGVGYAVNLAVSVALADFFIRGGGKPVFSRMKSQAIKGLESIGLRPDAAHRHGTTLSETALLPVGGHFITLGPVMWMEKHARYLTHTFNKWFDPNYQYKDLNVTLSTPEDHLPKMVDEPTDQTVGQVALRRAMGWGAVIATGVAMGDRRNNWITDKTFSTVENAVKSTGSPALQNAIKVPWVESQLKLAALDSWYTVITSAITYATNTMFGNKKNGYAEEEKAACPVCPPCAPETRLQSVHSARPPAGPEMTLNA